MAETFLITPPVVAVPGSATTVSAALVSELRVAIDISAWDEIDIQFNLATIGGVSSVPVLRVDFLTAMQRDVEDESWNIFSDSPTPDSVLFSVGGSAALWKQFRVPSASGGGTGKPLLRYLRYRAWFTTVGSAPTATFSASGIGRRKGS